MYKKYTKKKQFKQKHKTRKRNNYNKKTIKNTRLLKIKRKNGGTQKKNILGKVSSYAHSKLFGKKKDNNIGIDNLESTPKKKIKIVKQIKQNMSNTNENNLLNGNSTTSNTNLNSSINDYIDKEVKKRFKQMTEGNMTNNIIKGNIISSDTNDKNVSVKNNLETKVEGENEEIEYDSEFCNPDKIDINTAKEKMLKKTREEFRTCMLNKTISRERCEKILEEQIDSYQNVDETTENKKLKMKFPSLDNPNFNNILDDYLTGKTGHCNFTIPLAETVTTDDCGGNMKGGGRIKPFRHQVLVSKIIHPQTSIRGMLAFHGLGSGKTILSAVTIANFIRYEPERVICYIAPPGLVSNFYKDLYKFDNFVLFGHEIANSFNEYSKELKKELMNTKLSEMEIKTIIKEKMDRKKVREVNKRVVVMSYESWGNRLRGTTAWDTAVNAKEIVETKKNRSGLGGIISGTNSGKTRRMDTPEKPIFDNTLVIMDEVQELISSKDKKVIPHMNWIQQAVRNANDIRILFMTATPMKSHPYELGVLLNLLKPMSSSTRFNEFYEKDARSGCTIVDAKKTLADFNATFVNKTEDIEEAKNIDLFRSKIKGMISYYSIERNIGKFAVKNEMRPVIVDMEDKHYKAWREMRDKEIEECEKKKEKITCNSSTIKKCKSSRQMSLNANSRKEKIKSSIKKEKLSEDASKIFYACDNIDKLAPKGKQFIYSEFNVNGVYALKMELRRRGWVEYGFGKSDGEPNWVSIESLFTKESYRTKLRALNDDMWVEKADMTDEEKMKSGNTGGGSWENQTQPLEKRKAFITMGDNTDSKYKEGIVKGLYNRMKNINGDFINCMIVNSKYSEGISLFHVQQVHILEPPTSISLRDQIIGRAIRSCSHKGLSFPDKWRVSVYEYYSTHGKLGYYEPMRMRTLQATPTQNTEQISTVSQGGAPRKIKVEKQWCSGFVGKDECNLKEHCQWSEIKEGENANKCMELSTDFVISKMSDRSDNLKQQFLKLLKESAVDCVAFKNANELDLQCYRPHSKEYNPSEEIEKTYSIESKKCDEMGDDECNESKGCILNNNKCEIIKLESSECKKYANDRNCLKNNWCNWDETTEKCFTYYTDELKKHTNGISFDMNTNGNNKFVVEIKNITDKVIDNQLQGYFKKLYEANNSLQIENTLEQIYDLLKIYIEMRKEYKIKLVKTMNEIKKNKMELWTDKIYFVYQYILKMIINQETNKDGIGASFLSMFNNKSKNKNMNQNDINDNVYEQLTKYYEKKNARDTEKYKQVWLTGDLYNQTQTINLFDIKKTNDELDYILKLQVGHDETRKKKGLDYLLVSKNIKGMAIDLNLKNIEKIKKITKEFKYYDINIKLEFELLFGKFNKINISYNIDKELHENPIKSGYEHISNKIEY